MDKTGEGMLSVGGARVIMRPCASGTDGETQAVLCRIARAAFAALDGKAPDTAAAPPKTMKDS